MRKLKNIFKIILVVSCVGMIVGLTYAQEVESLYEPPSQQEIFEGLESKLESFKEQNPQLYEKMKARIETQKQINEILGAFYAKEVTPEDARAQLEPLVQEQINSEEGDLQARISAMERQLSELRLMQEDPDLAIQRRIDLLLGVSAGQ